MLASRIVLLLAKEVAKAVAPVLAKETADKFKKGFFPFLNLSMEVNMKNILNKRTVTITLTQSCNLNCIYCYEHNKSQNKIDFSTAKKIIDKEFANNRIDEFEFDLFGGEPFLEFELIQKITEYICANKAERKCTVFATTNGTLVHGKIQEWLKQHSHCFVCGLSLDGTRDMHNTNRSNSYDDIDLDFFVNQYPEQDVKMTISEQTLSSLAEGVIDMHKKGFLVSCNLAYEIDWSNPANSEILERELKKLIDFYISNPNIQPCSMLDDGIESVLFDETQAKRYCGTGKYMTSYDVDGEAYPCQFFMPLSLGEKSKNIDKIKFPDDTFDISLLDEKCQTCIIRNLCPNCFGANYAATGNIYKRDENMCKLTKIMIMARSFFKAEQWKNNQLKASEEEIQTLLRAIIKIQKEL